MHGKQLRNYDVSPSLCFSAESKSISYTRMKKTESTLKFRLIAKWKQERKPRLLFCFVFLFFSCMN